MRRLCANLDMVCFDAGDAVINMRKKKLIATYELKLVLGWEGSAKAAGGAPVSGKITLPYVSEVRPADNGVLDNVESTLFPRATLFAHGAEYRV